MATLIVKAGGGGDFTSISAALNDNSTATGDTIEIQDNSVYTEEVRYNTTPILQNITIKAGTGYSPILDGNSETLDIGIECIRGGQCRALKFETLTNMQLRAWGVIGFLMFTTV